MFSSAPMSPPAFYQAFLAILEVYGFIAVPAGNNIMKDRAGCGNARAARERPALAGELELG